MNIHKLFLNRKITLSNILISFVIGLLFLFIFTYEQCFDMYSLNLRMSIDTISNALKVIFIIVILYSFLFMHSDKLYNNHDYNNYEYIIHSLICYLIGYLLSVSIYIGSSYIFNYFFINYINIHINYLYILFLLLLILFINIIKLLILFINVANNKTTDLIYIIFFIIAIYLFLFINKSATMFTIFIMVVFLLSVPLIFYLSKLLFTSLKSRNNKSYIINKFITKKLFSYFVYVFYINFFILEIFVSFNNSFSGDYYYFDKSYIVSEESYNHLINNDISYTSCFVEDCFIDDVPFRHIDMNYNDALKAFDIEISPSLNNEKSIYINKIYENKYSIGDELILISNNEENVYILSGYIDSNNIYDCFTTSNITPNYYLSFNESDYIFDTFKIGFNVNKNINIILMVSIFIVSLIISLYLYVRYRNTFIIDNNNNILILNGMNVKDSIISKNVNDAVMATYLLCFIPSLILGFIIIRYIMSNINITFSGIMVNFYYNDYILFVIIYMISFALIINVDFNTMLKMFIRGNTNEKE